MDQKIANLVEQLFNTDVTASLTRPDPQFGDYATNVALQLAKPLGKNPRDIAEQLAERLRESGDFSEVTVAGPGFINIRLSDNQLIKQLKPVDSSSRSGEKIVIETNNPNPFKAMHIGHAFNAILADTVANLLGEDGADVHRVSYHGDVGAHVGKSMWAILRFVDDDITKLHAVKPDERNTFMSRMYAEGAAAYKNDVHAKEEITVLAQESFAPTDPLYSEIYATCKAWSFDDIDRIVARLGNKPIEKRYLEGEADALGVETVRAHVGDVFIESDGALVFPGSKYGSFDNAFVTSQGRGLYGARDLGLMQLKDNDYHATKSFIVTAEEQRDYFKGVIKAAELCLPSLTEVTVNISTGTVKLTTGKMSSRTGDVVEISWLFDVIGQAITDRGGEASDDIIAGALRYQFLKVKIGSDVVFDVNEAVSLHGNSGSYLQYAYARANSVLQKVATPSAELTDVVLQPDERPLVRKLTEYSDVLTAAKRDLLPHHICTYLYELAQEFNRFYEKNKVVGSDREAERAALVAHYAAILKAGLSVLGIDAPEKM
ncbi:MAG TPA: arginine--tRNA ligase [Candidatus Saccharimonadales bacterium]|nr:arginine--tRNA ligase [Candidatus Saccharimonadales bacterium]